ncbi:MAG: hypothetical protein ACE5LC_03400 [Candidatus Aminicenantales bacterium]
MNWGMYSVLAIIIFALFIILMILNPNLSCFGRRITSPLYPLLRKRKRKIKTHDYGFKLVDQPSSRVRKQIKPSDAGKTKIKKTDGYGFHLD